MTLATAMLHAQAYAAKYGPLAFERLEEEVSFCTDAGVDPAPFAAAARLTFPAYYRLVAANDPARVPDLRRCYPDLVPEV